MSFSVETILYMIGVASSCFLCLLAMSVVRQYNISKPMGMQTLLGKVTVIFTYAATVCDIVKMSALCVTHMFSPMPKYVAMVMVVIEYYLIVVCLTSLLALTITKYMSIFHGHVIDMFEERVLVYFLKVFVVLFSGFVAVVEYLVLSNFEDLYNYQQKASGCEKMDAHAEQSKSVIVFINVVMMVILYVRIEYSSLQANDTNSGLLVKHLIWFRRTDAHNGQVSDADMQSEFSIKTFRAVAACGLLVVGIFVYKHFLADTLWANLTFIISATVIIPFIFILNHPGMRSTAKKIIKL